MAYFGFVDTRMVQQIMDDEGAARRDELLPAFIRRRITPEAAAEALAQAIERRRARVIAPRYWAALSMLRGIANPALDYLSAHDKRRNRDDPGLPKLNPAPPQAADRLLSKSS